MIDTTGDGAMQLADNDSDGEPGDSSEDDEAINEALVGKGLGNCLQVLRKRGVLGKGFVKGRNTDKTLETQLGAFEKKKGGD